MLFSTDDYPVAAMSNNEEGNVRVELTITTAGRVGDCRVVESSNSAALDVATCSLMQRRARYVPARDAAGRLAEDRQSVRIRWRLEGSASGTPFASWVYRSIMRLDERRQPVGCRYEYGGKGVDLANCEAMFVMARELLAAARPTLPSMAPASLVVENRFEAGPEAAMAVREARPEEQVIQVNVAEFEIGPDGKLGNCRSIRQQGNPRRDLCESPFSKNFVKAPGPKRVGRMSITAYAMVGR
jgi:TonB family protein